MLNFLRPFFARLFNPIVQGLARTPVTPNMITVAGTVGVSFSSPWINNRVDPTRMALAGSHVQTGLAVQIAFERWATNKACGATFR